MWISFIIVLWKLEMMQWPTVHITIFSHKYQYIRSEWAMKYGKPLAWDRRKKKIRKFSAGVAGGARFLSGCANELFASV